MLERRRVGTLVVLATALILATAAGARADGDPASDVLLTQRVSFPFDSRTSSGAQKTLLTAVTEANMAGYPIRVAVIEKPTDLGLVTSLWAKPKQYARFLDAELAFVFKGPVLIVMPAGLGFAHFHKPTEGEGRVLASIPVDQGADGLARTATLAVERLSAEQGHPIARPPSPAGKSSVSTRRLVGAGGAVLVVALALAVAAFALVRTRRSRRLAS